MQDLKVTSWQLFGHDRLYVNLPDGTAIGWADLGNGTITVLHPRYRDAVLDALARQVPDMPSLLGEDAPEEPPAPTPPPQVPRIPPMRGMRKRVAAPDAEPLPAPGTEREAAPDAEHVPAPRAEPVPVAEQAPAPQPPPGRESPPEPPPGPKAAAPQSPTPPEAAAPQAAPAPDALPEPGGVAGAERPGGPAALPALTPASDLAARRAGEELRELLGESAAGTLVRAATGALRRNKEADPRRTALAGERRAGAELRRLTRHGWRVLHSVPLPDGTWIGHLLIGPGGVFAVSTEHHPGASVRIDDGTLRIDDGDPRPYELGASPGARRAGAALAAHCSFDVPVGTVLLFTGVTALEVVATPAGVRVCREREVSALAPLTGVLTATQVERVYDVARNREAWREA
ncbi:nuclease-related domain-containing protein [Streptomyces sp. NPDC006288]|uniref:nuclease-related domain-containing protein n=1 Tax=Streptomyces sp. NPDC006288 TaxID=3156743 RepID=UPI00339DBE8D